MKVIAMTVFHEAIFATAVAAAPGAASYFLREDWRLIGQTREDLGVPLALAAWQWHDAMV